MFAFTKGKKHEFPTVRILVFDTKTGPRLMCPGAHCSDTPAIWALLCTLCSAAAREDNSVTPEVIPMPPTPYFDFSYQPFSSINFCPVVFQATEKWRRIMVVLNLVQPPLGANNNPTATTIVTTTGTSLHACSTLELLGCRA